LHTHDTTHEYGKYLFEEYAASSLSTAVASARRATGIEGVSWGAVLARVPLARVVAVERAADQERSGWHGHHLDQLPTPTSPVPPQVQLDVDLVQPPVRCRFGDELAYLVWRLVKHVK
jgi:hypothetical protein